MTRRAYLQRDELPEYFEIPDDVLDGDAEDWVCGVISAYYEDVDIQIENAD
jgi:hypothetical protein